MEEIWKDIPGYEGIYKVSTFGNVKSITRKITKTHPSTGTIYKCNKKGVILKGNFDLDGYIILDLYNNDRIRRKIKAHRVVALVFINNPENKPEVNHKDGIKTNNNVSNLEWVTQPENKKHAISTGLFNSAGENNAMSKLNRNAVIEIRSLVYPEKDLAIKYNVTIETIQNVNRRKTWTSLD